jgi:hypothetical protein
MSDWLEVDIKVFVHPDQEPKFHLECDDLPKKPDDPNHFIFDNDGHPGFLLSYVLQGDAAGYRFPDRDHMDEALYSAKGAGCPTAKGQWGQFKAKDVTSDNKTLIVRNMNQHGHEGEFGYTLRVTKTPHDADNATYLDLDPGGTNNNGSTTIQISYLNVALVGATTGIVSAIATTLILAKLNMVCPAAPGF